MSTLFRRCGCRRPDGSGYPVLPERSTPQQKAVTCPRLVRDSNHGTWAFTVSGPPDRQTGKRVQVRRMGFALKREAQQACAEVTKQITEGDIRGGTDRTLGDWLADWIERRERDGLRAATVVMYRRYIQRDIVPAIGQTKLRELRRHHVDTFLQRLLRDGRGVVTVHRIHAVISSALTLAFRLDLVSLNAASGVALPRERAEKLRVWEPDQVLKFLAIAGQHRLGPIYELVIRTGLRRGEIAGLRWEDIDLKARRLVVRQQRVQVDTIVVTNHAKTDNGQDRRVTLDAESVQHLKQWRALQESDRELLGSGYQDDGWVFTYEDGRPLHPYYISDVFRRLVKQSGLPPLTFHGLRHEHASLLLSAGVSITAVSKRLGHSSAAITSDLYSHLLEDADRQMADAVQGVLDAPNRFEHTLSTHGPGEQEKGPTGED